MAGRTVKKAATRKGNNDPINSDGEEESDDDGSSEDEYRAYVKGKGDVEYKSSEEESSDSEDEDVEEVTKKPSKKKGPTKKKKNDKKRKKQASKDLTITPRAVSTKKARPVPYAARVSTGGDGFETPTGSSVAIQSTGAEEHNTAALLADNAALRRQMEQMHQFMGCRGGKGKTVTRKLRREGLGSTDHLNIKELYTYIMDQVWRYFKMMPKGWNKYRIEPLSTCAQMLAKVTVPNGMQPEFYWSNVIVVFANDKLCATRANFKMNLLKRYKGMCVNCLFLLP